VQVNENQELLDDWKTPEKNLQILWEEVHDLTAGHGTGKVAGRGPWEGSYLRVPIRLDLVYRLWRC